MRPVGRRKPQVNTDAVALGSGLVAGEDIPLPGGETGQGLAETSHEIHLDAAIPPGERPKCFHRSLDLIRRRQHPQRAFAAPTTAQRVHHIENQVRRLSLAEGIAMDTNAGGSGEFGEHAELRQPNSVVAGRRQLLAVGEGRGLPLAQQLRLHGVERRHHQEMPSLRGTGAVQPGVAEAKQLIVSVVVARGVQRALMEQEGSCLGAQAHHAEGDHRAREVVPANPGVAASANERVDPPAQFAGLNARLQLARPGTDNPVVSKNPRPNTRNTQQDRYQNQP